MSTGAAKESFSHRRCRRIGFTLLETGITMSILAMLAALSVISYNYIKTGNSRVSAAPLLSTAQSDLRRTAGSDGQYPADVLALLVALPGSSISYVAGVVADSVEVSVYRQSATEVVLAALAGAGCLVLIDRPFGSSTWVLDVDAAADCSASILAVDALALTPSGSPLSVTTADLNG